MKYNVKKSVILLALMLYSASAVPAWSEENPATEPVAVSEPEQTNTVAETAPATSSEPAAQVAAAESDASAAPYFESHDSAPAETLPPSYNPFNYLVYKPLWALNGVIGDFNPIGKHVAAPLEEAVPGLRFKGFINSITQINTTNTNHSVGFGKRDKDWWLQKQEFRVQAEFKYQVNENIDVVNVNNFLFDGAYKWQDSKGLFLDGSLNQEYYQQFKRVVREAYVRGNYGKFNYTLGKQIVNWGKMDGKVIDIVNAADGRDVVDFHNGDYEWRAIGQWMAYFSVRPTETTTVSLLWNPDFQPNVGPAGGSPYWFPFAPTPQPGDFRKTKEILPGGLNNIQDSEAGIRLDTTVGALAISGIYYYGFDRDAVFFTSDKSLHHPRINWYGYALDYGTNILGQRLVVRSEGLYTQGKNVGTSDPAATDGVVQKDQLKVALALETAVFSAENQINILYQPIWTHNLNLDSRTGLVRNNLLHVVNLNHSFRATNDRLSLSTTFYIDGGGNTNGGWAANYAASWGFNESLKATVAYNDYQGKDDQIPWGAYNKHKNVTLDVKYEW